MNSSDREILFDDDRGLSFEKCHKVDQSAYCFDLSQLGLVNFYLDLHDIHFYIGILTLISVNKEKGAKKKGRPAQSN